MLRSLFALLFLALPVAAQPAKFFDAHCLDCHSGKTPKGDLDLLTLKLDPAKPDTLAKWVKVYDRIESGEMPPKKQARPPADDVKAAIAELKAAIVKAEVARRAGEPHTRLRRLTRAEYENTMRDLFDLPGILLRDDLPADGSVNGFDKHADALDLSHVNMAKYMEAADRVLNTAVATQPEPPVKRVYRVSAANEASTLGHTVLEGDATLLKDRKPDPNYPPAGKHRHLDYGAHLSLDMHRDTSPGASVGLFRGEDVAYRTSFAEFIAVYPGTYRVRINFWAFKWDKGTVLPAEKAETARMDVWHITGDGRGTDHPSTLLGYFDAPVKGETAVDFRRWLNPGDTFGFAFVSSQIYHQIRNSKERLMGFVGPGLGVDPLEVEGPFHDTWPPVSHKRLFGDLPLVEWKPESFPNQKPPKHAEWRQRFNARNQPDPPLNKLKLWTVKSDEPLADADRLLGNFLPRAFRRPVAAEVRADYVAVVDKRLKAGDCFETALRWAYKAALCSPDFLFHVEEERQKGVIDDHALACRLSYLFWNSMPDEPLTKLATGGTLHDPKVLKAEAMRLFNDPKSARFRDDFLTQWLKLHRIAANDPDPKLYPGFKKDLQDAMLAETHAYFRELLAKDLPAAHLIRSDFAMLNERLAKHYGITGVDGCQVRRVELPKDSPRGAFLTQAAILKITANGTTTSPVPRGVFVMDRLLGRPPEPPPPAVPAVEPDVRGATTIREQLSKHRDNASCAACHAKMDPPGFALESFDVIGGFRTKYQSVTDKKPPVDPSGVLADGRAFKDVREFQSLVAADSDRLLTNVAERYAAYATGRDLSFADRDAVTGIVGKAKAGGSGLRTLLFEVIQSELFQSR
jgi:hypothetical protein